MVNAGRLWIGVILMPDADRCVCCGEIIPEGRQVCPQCEGGTEKDGEQADIPHDLKEK